RGRPHERRRNARFASTRRAGLHRSRAGPFAGARRTPATMSGAALLLLTLALPASDTLVVSPAGPYRTVGEAVAAAPAGATVLVTAGVYREPTVELARRITLQGEPGAVLDGEGERQLIRVTADSVTIRGLT